MNKAKHMKNQPKKYEKKNKWNFPNKSSIIRIGVSHWSYVEFEIFSAIGSSFGAVSTHKRIIFVCEGKINIYSNSDRRSHQHHSE